MSEQSSQQGGSLRELGRQLGVSVQAVRKGIRSKRLVASLGQTAAGKPCILDFALAKVEWTRSSRTGYGATETPAPIVVPVAQVQAPEVAELSSDTEDVKSLQGVSTLIDAQRLATIERAKKLRLENDLAERRLMPRDLVEKEAFEAERIVREGLLNITARIAAELAAETDPAKVARKLDAAIRQALHATADALLAAHA